jgi:glutamate carboxypeptidase
MDSRFAQSLNWIDAQADRLRGLVVAWASIPSGSHDLSGLAAMADALRRDFAPLDARLTEHALPPLVETAADGTETSAPLGTALRWTKRPDAARRVLLGIHRDTVFGPSHPFRAVDQLDANTLRGPGVLDAKGGLAVMLIALEALERSGLANPIGWEVLVNPDEELGSPGSAALLAECARRNHVGLVFEPALPGGKLVSARKGSGNFGVVVRGRAAHVGRDFAAGRSAIHAAAEIVTKLAALNDAQPGVIANVGRVDGGGPTNVVAELAIVRFNLRVDDEAARIGALAAVEALLTDANQRDGIRATLHGSILSPPKPLDARTEHLLHTIRRCGTAIDLAIDWAPTGGVCDGNKLAAAGLPTVDSLGPRGGGMHSDEEFVLIDSLVERAKLAALLLLTLATDDGAWP